MSDMTSCTSAYEFKIARFSLLISHDAKEKKEIRIENAMMPSPTLQGHERPTPGHKEEEKEKSQRQTKRQIKDRMLVRLG